jgi:hypothetical protein
MKRPTSILLAATLTAALVGGGAVISSAQAEPAGCLDAASLSVSSGYLTGAAGGYCDTKATRTLVIEIKWDKTLATDPLVTSAYTTATSKDYNIAISTCDHGNTRSYYGRSYFTTKTNYHDTLHAKYKTCG